MASVRALSWNDFFYSLFSKEWRARPAPLFQLQLTSLLSSKRDNMAHNTILSLIEPAGSLTEAALRCLHKVSALEVEITVILSFGM